jgi:molybdenum cofactor guanylyltransferase
MGEDKGGLLLGRRTFLQHCCERFDRLGPWCAVGAKGGVSPQEFVGRVWLTDLEADRGPLEGLAVGLSWAVERAEWAWVSTVDAPVFSHELVGGLLGLASSVAASGVEIVMPRVGGQVFPLNALYRSSLGLRVRELVDRGRRRVSELPQHCCTLYVDEEELRGFDSELLSLQPINNPNQYRAFVQRMGLRTESG